MKIFQELGFIACLQAAMLLFSAPASNAESSTSTGDDAPTGAPPVITSPLSATTSINQQFTYQFTATGATSLAVPSPAPGLAFNAPLAAIVGQPTTAGIFPITLQATNAQGTTMATLTLRVEPIPASPTPTPTPTPTPGVTPTPTVSPTPCGVTLFSQNFDSVTAPALPVGWVRSNSSGDATFWVTSTTAPDTPPNDVFIPDQNGVSDKRLDTPVVTITSASTQLSFRNNFNTEHDPPPAEVFWDGGVLEVAAPNVNGGAFTDIINPAVGASFVSGGYTGAINATAGNPLAGRMAWSGDSGGYINTAVNLGPTLNGQAIRLRFRMGTDPTVSAPGWRVDTITIAVPPCPSPTPIITPTPPTLVITSGASATGRVNRPFSFQVIAKGATTNARLSATNLPPGLSADPITGLILGTASSPGSFLVTLTVTDGAVSAVATLQLTVTADPALPVITSANSMAITPGVPFSYQIQTDANTTSYFVAFAPPFLQFNPTTGVVSGTFPGPFGHDGGTQKQPDLSGGTVTNVQLFGSGTGGTGTLPMTIFLAPTGVINIATRLAVGTGENVLIGGFIIQGNAPKKLMIRAIGPSLTQFGVPNALADPVLDLSENAGLLFSNDNWRDNPGQASQILETRLQPSNDLEGAIVAYLNPGQYTAAVSGKNNGTGIGLAEVYDLGTASLAGNANAKLGNIATRGTVLGGDSVMIGGFIISGPNTRVLVRAIGPSLSNFGISGALPDPTLALKSANGTTLLANDDWQSDPVQAAEIQERVLAPTDPRESALVTTLPAGQFTAIVSGKGGATGVALVEVYSVQ